METNPSPVRSSHISLHLTEPLQDEINASEVSTPQSDVEIVPDTGGSSEPLDYDACLICNVSDKFVFRCSGTDCPIWFHLECMNPKSDDLTADPNYCPYCWFKLVYFRTKSMRVQVIEAEKAVRRYNLGKAKDTTLSGDDNGGCDHSVDCTDIVSDQGEKVASCLTKEEQVQVDMEENKGVDMVGASEDEEMLPENTEEEETGEDRTNVDTCAGKKGDASLIMCMQELILTDSEASSNVASLAQVTSQAGKMTNQERELSTAARDQQEAALEF